MFEATKVMSGTTRVNEHSDEEMLCIAPSAPDTVVWTREEIPRSRGRDGDCTNRGGWEHVVPSPCVCRIP